MNKNKVDRGDTSVVDKPLASSKSDQPKSETPIQYSNERFRKVTLQKIDNSKIRIKGEAQIFEATFNWMIINGNNKLKSGFVTTDAGAPEWGKFDFVIDADKINHQLTSNLILFEISAKDGSQQYKLSIPLN